MKQSAALTLGILAGLAVGVRAQDGAAEAKEAAGKPTIEFKTTKGDFTLELDPEKAPITTKNFLRYAEEGFFDGTIFHRVIPGFVVQGGGFTEDMTRKETHAPIRNEARNGLKNLRGTISMARTPDPNSATSQFFINLVDNAALDPNAGSAGYAVFGKITKGMEVIDEIAKVKTTSKGQYKDVPVEAIQVTKATASVSSASIEADLRDPAEVAMDEAKKYMEEVAKRDGVTKTESGLCYEVLTEGAGASPKASDTVKVHYEGKLVDGTVFDSSLKRGEPISFPLNRVIPGWTEGVQLMKVGGKHRLHVPPNLGYGARGASGVIPPNAALIFEVQLLEIQ